MDLNLPQADPEAKLLCDVQEVFIPPHIERCPVGLAYETTISTTNAHYCCWRSGEHDKIFLGGTDTITLLGDEGCEKKYNLWDENMKVLSGLPLTSVKQMILVKWEGSKIPTKAVFTVNISSDISADTELHPVNSLNIERPVCLFPFSKVFGILCKRDSSEYSPANVQFFTLKNILIDRYPSAAEVIKLDIKIGDTDTSCATPEGNLCVTSFLEHGVYIYNVDGELLNTYTSQATWTLGDHLNRAFWDGKRHRLFVQCCEGGVIAASDNGVLCALQKGRWNIVAVLQNIIYGVNGGCKMWCIDDENHNKIHVYKNDYLSLAHTESPVAIQNPTINCCPQELEYNKTIKTKNKYICCWRSDKDGEIFLGGRGRISILKEDGSVKTYKLWNETLKVICGLTVSSKDQLLCLKDVDNTHLYTVNIPSELPNETILDPTNYLQISSPIYIFAVSKIRYAVLCTSKQIEIFTLKNILLDTNPNATDVLNLDFDISYDDTACATPDGRICFTSLQTPALCIYNAEDEMMNSYSLECEMYAWFHRCLDEKHHRLFLQACGNGLVLVSDHGIVCTLKQEKLDNIQTLTKIKLNNTNAILNIVASEGRMWFIERHFGKESDTIHIYRCTTKLTQQTDLDSTLSPSEHAGYKMPVIKDGAKHIRSHTLPRKYVRIWNTADPGVMAMGGCDEYVIALINQDGDILRENMLYVPDVKKLQSGLNLYDKKLGVSYADRINSGLYLVQNMHAVITLKLNDTFPHKLLVVNIDPTYTTSIIKNMDIIRPVIVFDISTTQFGVLSWGKQPTNHIHVYNKQDQSHVSTTDVVYKAATTTDSVAVLPGGGWAVASCENDRVYMFDESGTLIETVGARAEHELMNKPGLLYHPYVIKVDTEGGILVTCVYGDTHRYHQHTWDLVAVFKGDQHGLWDYCYNGHNIFTVHKNKLKVFQINA